MKPSSYKRYAGVMVFLCSFLFYVFTLAPTVIWGDSATFATQAVAMHLKIAADYHPLFVLLGRLFSYLPFEVAYSVNLLAAVIASLAVLMVYLVILEMTGCRVSAMVGATALALSHAFWLYAVIAHARDLNVLFIVTIILVLLKWRNDPENLVILYFAIFLFGLGLGNHLIMSLEAFGFLFFVLLTDYRILFRLRMLLISTISLLSGLSLLIYIYIQKVIVGSKTSAVVDAATGGHYKKAMLVLSPAIFIDIGKYIAYLFYQFPLLGFLLGFLGIFALLKENRKVAFFLLILIGVNMSFFLTFGPGIQRTTKYTFYMSDYAIFSLFIGYGFFTLLTSLRNRGYSLTKVCVIGISLIILLPLSLYNVTPAASKTLGIDFLHARTIPYRDNETFFLNPNKRGYTGAERYGMEALETASTDAIIIADPTPFAVLKYFQQVRGVRKDILVLFHDGYLNNRLSKDVVFKYYGKRDMYLADIENRYYKISELKDDYDFVPEGVLYKIVKKNKGTPLP